MCFQRNPEPPPAKKAKSEENNEKKPVKSSKEEENKWQLDKNRFVSINEFRGRRSIDIREFYEKDGKTLPGKKGISLSLAQFKKLLENKDEILAAAED